MNSTRTAHFRQNTGHAKPAALKPPPTRRSSLIFRVGTTLVLLLFGCGDFTDTVADLPSSPMANTTLKTGHHQHAGPCTIVSARDGRWSNQKTWRQHRIPEPGDHVCVQHRIKYQVTKHDAVNLRSVTIHGRLTFARRQSTQLRVHDLIVQEGGLLEIGTKTNPLPEDVLAEIVFVAQEEIPTDSPHFPHQLGLFTHGGRLELHGRDIQRIAHFEFDLMPGQRRIRGRQHRNLAAQLKAQGWRTKDRVLLPATRFQRNKRPENEVRTVSILGNAGIEFDTPLEASHVRIRNHPLYAANLSANIVIRSAAPHIIEQRGHVMVMPTGRAPCGETNLSGVRFEGLGRTNKALVIGSNNQRMMYGLHFHKCGSSRRAPSHSVTGSVVVDSPGWGFVNHGSHVIFQGNVAYDFTGAGFVAEAGNERGEFVNNLAVGGRGVKSYRYRRLYLNEKERIAQADLGFHGDGFWIASPFVAVRSNAAIGNDGSGFIWYQVGLDSRFIGRPQANNHLSLTVGPQFLTSAEKQRIGYTRPLRSWIGRPNEFLISDLPILQSVTDNYAGSNFVGLRVRYGRSFNSSFLKKFWDGGPDVERSLEGETNRQKVYSAYSVFSDHILQNNEIGLHTTYSTRLKFSRISIDADKRMRSRLRVNTPEFEESAATGLEMNHFSNGQHVLSDMHVTGYPVCERRSRTDGQIVRREEFHCTDSQKDVIVWPNDDIKRRRR